jgi:hypothetical protein
MVNYVSSKTLLDEVRNEMPVYFETSKVDESILLPVIRKCVSQMGVGHFKEDKATLTVRQNKAILPKDFHRLSLAISCLGKTYTRPHPTMGIMEQEVGLCKVDECDTFRIHLDECGNMFKIEQQLPYESWSWDQYALMSIEKSSFPSCHATCPNLHSDDPYSITIKNGEIFTNFAEGIVYIEYIVDPNTPNGYDIPDNPKVREWIKETMKLKIFEYLYDNMEPDIENRLGNAKQRANAAELQAISVYKMSEFQQFYELRNRLAARYNARAKSILYGKYCRPANW